MRKAPSIFPMSFQTGSFGFIATPGRTCVSGVAFIYAPTAQLCSGKGERRMPLTEAANSTLSARRCVWPFSQTFDVNPLFAHRLVAPGVAGADFDEGPALGGQLDGLGEGAVGVDRGVLAVDLDRRPRLGATAHDDDRAVGA